MESAVLLLKDNNLYNGLRKVIGLYKAIIGDYSLISHVLCFQQGRGVFMQRLQIEITGRCNLGCEFCYNDLGGADVSLDEIGSITSAAEDYSLDIGGGEPFMHPQLREIILSHIEKTSRILISTNGTLLPSWLFSLDDAIKDRVLMQVSLPAGTRERYQQICGADMLETVIANARQINDHFQTHFHSVIYRRNLDEAVALAEHAKETGILLYVTLLFPVGRAKGCELLSGDEIEVLRDALLPYAALSIVKSPIFSQTTHCRLYSELYGFEKKGRCAAEEGAKSYVDQKGNRSTCQFCTCG